ncbi:MAG: MotA/TolQ/ExbB proton channel family protein [Ectothiorhodospiraceae bacterium]|jgi:biopolymer transport protein ExbB
MPTVDTSTDLVRGAITHGPDTLVAWLNAGGPVLQILMGLSVLALTVTLLKLYQFARLSVWSDGGTREALEYWRENRPQEAIDSLGNTRNPVAEVVAATMQRLQADPDPATAREEAQRIATDWLENLGRYLRILDVIGALSPLLGLLGTVLGMIDAFQQIQAAGSQLDPGLLAGGIWEALLTTAAGLTVAIPTVAVLHGLEHLVDRVRHRMEDGLTRVFTRGTQSAPGAVEPVRGHY